MASAKNVFRERYSVRVRGRVYEYVRFRARVHLNGRKIHLGRFRSRAKAAAAVARWRKNRPEHKRPYGQQRCFWCEAVFERLTPNQVCCCEECRAAFDAAFVLGKQKLAGPVTAVLLAEPPAKEGELWQPSEARLMVRMVREAEEIFGRLKALAGWKRLPYSA